MQDGKISDMCILKHSGVKCGPLPAAKNIQEPHIEAADGETVLSQGPFMIAHCLSVLSCGIAVDVCAIDCA